MLETMRFLHRLTFGDDPAISHKTHWRAVVALWEIDAASNQRMPTPAASSGGDGEVFFSWDTDVHHLELEIIPHQDYAEFFYRDRVSEFYWLEEYRAGEKIPEKVREIFEKFVA